MCRLQAITAMIPGLFASQTSAVITRASKTTSIPDSCKIIDGFTGMRVKGRCFPFPAVCRAWERTASDRDLDHVASWLERELLAFYHPTTSHMPCSAWRPAKQHMTVVPKLSRPFILNILKDSTFLFTRLLEWGEILQIVRLW